jgi:PEGA domain-containing protein
MKHLLLAALLVGSVPAQAQDAAKAKKALREGTHQFKKGRWQRALDAFQEAYRLAPSPGTLVQIADTYREMGRPMEALENYQRVVGEGDPDARARAEQEIGKLDAQVGKLAFDAPAGTRVLVPGRELGTTPLEPVRLMPGSYNVTLAVPGRAEVQVSAVVVAGMTETVRPPPEKQDEPAVVAAVPPPAPPTTPAPRVAPPPAEAATTSASHTAVAVDLRETAPNGPSPTQLRLAWATVGVGGALLVAGGVFALLAHSANSDVNDCLDAPRWTPSCDDAVDRRRTYAPLAYTLTGVGAAAAIGGGVWVYMLHRQETAAGARLQILPDGAFVLLDVAR